jgi:hypothetical protein
MYPQAPMMSKQVDKIKSMLAVLCQRLQNDLSVHAINYVGKGGTNFDHKLKLVYHHRFDPSSTQHCLKHQDFVQYALYATVAPVQVLFIKSYQQIIPDVRLSKWQLTEDKKLRVLWPYTPLFWRQTLIHVSV